MQQTQISLNEVVISVVIPFVQGRGQEQACIKSWVQQTYPAEKFEVIVATDGSQPQLERQIKALLRPGDILLQHSSHSRSALYDCGARRARGKLLVFTELHCLAAPECLAEAARFFDTHPNLAAARCRNEGISPTRLAQLEDRVYDETYRVRSATDHWYRVALRGFVIYRQLYLELGGLEPDFGLFAEPLLAARLHSRGCQVGEASRAIVRHYNSPILANIPEDVKDYTYGECHYRLRNPVEYCERYFGHAPEWANRLVYQPAIARQFSQAIAKGLAISLWSAGPVDLLVAQIGALEKYGPMALLGMRWPLFKARAATIIARLRIEFWRFHEERCYRAYCDYWYGTIPYSRLEFINQHPLSLPALTWPETFQYDMAQTEAERFVGFYGIETWQGQSFRWSGPAALAQVSLPVGAYEVQLQLLAVRLAQPSFHLQLFFNGHRIQSFSQDSCSATISFQLDPAMFAPGVKFHQLVFICNPWKPWKHGSADRRQLGLPVKGIYFRPVL